MPLFIPQPRQRIVTVAHAAILTLPTTPVLIIPAAGANLVAALAQASFAVNTTAAAYTNVDPGVYTTLAYGNSTIDFEAMRGIEESTTLYETGGIASAGEPGRIIQGTATDVANLGVYLWVNNAAAGNFTGGNASNTFIVTAWYWIYDLVTGTYR